MEKIIKSLEEQFREAVARTVPKNYAVKNLHFDADGGQVIFALEIEPPRNQEVSVGVAQVGSAAVAGEKARPGTAA